MKIFCFGFLLLFVTSDCRSVQPVLQNSTVFSQYNLALEAIFGLGIRLQALLDQDNPISNTNFVISPISATTIVAELLLGAEGKFQEQLYDLLSLPKTEGPGNFQLTHYKKERNDTYILKHATFHLQLSSLLKTLENSNTIKKLYTLKQKSGLFVDNRIKLNVLFEKHLKTFYDADIFPLNFKVNETDNQKFINDWASKQTNGLIPNVFQTPPPATTASVLMNAVYFLAEWETPFDDLLNNNGTFYTNTNETVNTTYMMGNIEQIMYSESETYRIICLPYKKNELGMYIILPNDNHPDKYNIKKFAQNLSSKEILQTMSTGKIHDVIVKIPKLTLSNSFSILKPLQKYREYKEEIALIKNNTLQKDDVFDQLTDNIKDFSNFISTKNLDVILKGAAVDTELRINDIVQEMVFSINEKGTEAAAISTSTIDYINQSKTFIINRPFSFFIRHEETSATLFWGTISDPSTN